jgi:hypothetical protein
MNNAVINILLDALNKGRVMRQAQREFFATRSIDALSRSKQAERDFDRALEDADFAIEHGEPRMKQGELFRRESP